MKSIVFSILTAMALCGCAGKFAGVELPDQKRVVQVNNTGKHELYVRANNWMVEAFNNAESVIQFSDIESGSITGKYVFGTILRKSEYNPTPVYAEAIIKVKLKDNYGKIIIKPIEKDYMNMMGYVEYKNEQAIEDMISLLNSFETAIKSQADDDW